MAATRAEIAGWFDRGVKEGGAYMIVWCDDYDYTDYPSFYADKDLAQKALDMPSSMQRAMECYELDPAKKAEQLAMHRCWALR